MGSYFLSHLHALGGGVLGYLVPFLFVLSLVVFFHELGHFLVARLCGVRILVFSIGFGPELVGFNDRHGTRWKIAAIPLGGYVKFFGDENASSVPDAPRLEAMTEDERAHSFFFQPVYKLSLIHISNSPSRRGAESDRRDDRRCRKNARRQGKGDHDGLSDAAIPRTKVIAPLNATGGGFDTPRHVAIIMDGNGRWASGRGLPRVEGHRRGVEALRKTVRAASDLGISVLTIFSFSSENWSRPQSEIRDLLSLLRRFIRNDLADLQKSNVRCV